MLLEQINRASYKLLCIYGYAENTEHCQNIMMEFVRGKLQFLFSLDGTVNGWKIIKDSLVISYNIKNALTLSFWTNYSSEGFKIFCLHESIHGFFFMELY